MVQFCVELDIFHGPLDLLLYLVREHELPIAEISLARLTGQYLQYLEVLEQLDVNEVGEFIDVAAQLLEMKSRLVLPHEEPLPAAGQDESQHQLIQRLLEYKRYRDAASVLEEKSRAWQQRYPRLARETAGGWTDVATQPIQEVELWDLVSAFGRIIRDNRTVQPSSIVYDETPIQHYMDRIMEQLRARGRIAFSDLFVPGMHKSAMIGMFLAVLELVRHHRVATEQRELHGEIWLYFAEPDAPVRDVAGGAQQARPPAGSLTTVGLPLEDQRPTE